MFFVICSFRYLPTLFFSVLLFIFFIVDFKMLIFFFSVFPPRPLLIFTRFVLLTCLCAVSSLSFYFPFLVSLFSTLLSYRLVAASSLSFFSPLFCCFPPLFPPLLKSSFLLPSLSFTVLLTLFLLFLHSYFSSPCVAFFASIPKRSLFNPLYLSSFSAFSFPVLYPLLLSFLHWSRSFLCLHLHTCSLYLPFFFHCSFFPAIGRVPLLVSISIHFPYLLLSRRAAAAETE